MTEQLRTFLSRVLPWPQEDEPQTFIGVHWATAKLKQDGKPFWNSRAARTVDEAIHTIHWVQRLPDARDIYIAMGAQKECLQKVSKVGNRYLEAIRNHNNVASLKSLFLDIDVKGGDKGYDDIPSAAGALATFIKAIDLPRPTLLVGSGGGLHAHWELAEPLTVQAWQPLASALAEATRQQGLRCDTQCTVDPVRVLRPPETQNWKTDPPRPTTLLGKVAEGAYSVERIERALAPFMKSAPVVSDGLADLGAAPAALRGIANDAAAGISTAPPVMLDEVAKECPFIAEAITTGGASFDQPLWNLTTLIGSFGEYGRDDAHRMAKGHSGYTQEETDNLFDRKMRERLEKGLGWPSCGAILNAGSLHCRTCPKLKEGKSPLNFTPKPPPVPPNPNGLFLPPKHSVDAAGFVCVEQVDDTGGKTLVPLIEYPVSDPWVQKDPWLLHFACALHDNVKSKIEIPAEAMMAVDTLRKELARQGVVTKSWLNKPLQEFFVSWIKTLQSRKNAVIESAPFGWNTNQGTVDGFCFGGEVWTTNGSRPAPNADRILAQQYKPTGSVDPWNEAIKLVTQRGRPELEAIVATAFGSPLVKATGWYGAFLAAYSKKSGIGKTTAMKVAQAVWGDPQTAMQGLSDTINSVTKKIGSIRSLPLYWDEIKGDEDTQAFTKLAFQLTSGKEKSRLGRDIKLREVGKWQTMLVSASNDSLLDYVALQSSGTTAGLYRLFEFEVSPKAKIEGDVDTGEAQRILGRLDDNYGVIGAEYAKWLGQNYSRIDAEVGELVKRLEKDWAFRQDERFWLCTIACVVMGARYANELGFTTFDVDAIEAFMRQTLDNMRVHLVDTHIDLTNPTNVINVLSQFLKAMNRHTIWTNKVPVGRGRPKAGAIKIVKMHQHLDGVQVHIGKEDKIVRISSTHLSYWLDKNTNVSRQILMGEFKKRFGAEKVIGRLGAGTDYAEATEHLIEIHAAGTPLAAFIDGGDEEATDGQ